jgi:N-acetylneuraminate lyase|tara:strand:- start:122 stop:592 length:471 start_codon:yes stop_codon:yes gene_type:complete
MNEFVAVASKEIENFAGIKFTQENLEDFRKTKNHKARLNVLFGVDELFLKSLDCGAKGWVGSTYNHIAPLYFEIKRLYEKGEVDLAEDLQKKAVLFVETLNSFGGYNGVAKGFMGVLGIDCGPSRFPHNNPDKKTYDVILEKLKIFGLEKYFGKNA